MVLLVPLDLSPDTDLILAQVVALAAPNKDQVFLVHVADPDPAFVGYEAGPDVVRDHVADTMRHEHKAIQQHAEALREQGIDTTALLVQGPTVDSILAEVLKRNADMIIMGSHGHGAMHNLLLGSVSEGVIRHTLCPILLVPSRTQAD